MLEMHSKQLQFTYNACGPFNKNKERIQKFKEAGDSRWIYKNELEKASFRHDMAYGDFKDLAKRIALDKVLRNKAFNIAKNPRYDGYQRGLASIVYKYFDKKSKGSGVAMLQNDQITNDLHKSIRKFIKRKVYSSFKDNIWGADLSDMQLISKFNKEFRFLWCIIDIFSRYAWVVPLKDKEGVTIINAFQKILMIQKESQIRYGLIKEIDQWNHD